MFFVCEQRARKAAATERQPQRAERASTQGAGQAFFPLRATTTAADSKRDARAANKGRASPATSWSGCCPWCRIGAHQVRSALTYLRLLGKAALRVVADLALGGSGHEHDNRFLYIHSAPSALCRTSSGRSAACLVCPYALTGFLSQIERACYRTGLSLGPALAARMTRLASALKGWQRIRFRGDRGGHLRY